MTTLIKNGRIITATDDYLADVFIDGETVAMIGKKLPSTPIARSTLQTGWSSPARSIRTSTWNCRSAAPFLPTTSKPARSRRRLVAQPPSSTSRFSTTARRFQQTLDDWDAKAEGKCAIDYSYHLAVTEYEPKHEAEFKKVVDRGITTFKIFLAYPGVFMIDDTTMFRVMQSAGEVGGMTLVHAENGIAIQQMIDNLIAAGKVEPKYHAESRPPIMQADGVARALRVGEVAEAPVFIVHVSCEAAMNEIVRSPRRRQREFRRDVHAVPLPRRKLLRQAELRRGQIRLHPAARPEGKHRAAVEGS